MPTPVIDTANARTIICVESIAIIPPPSAAAAPAA